MAVYADDLLIHQFRGITVIKILMQMCLFLFQFNLIFILKECARFACTSTLINILFEICFNIVDFEEIKTPGSYFKICCSTSQRNSTMYRFPQ